MSISTYYRVVIDAVSEAAPRDGFIDNTKVEQYLAVVGSIPAGFDLADSRAKERANVRYDDVVNRLSQMANLYVSNISAPSADAETAPTEFAFTVEIERGDDILATHDESTPGVVLTGTAAIARCVARSMISTLIVMVDTFDPTKTTGPGNLTQAVRRGTRIETLTIGSLAANLAAAAALIEVTKIENVG